MTQTCLQGNLLDVPLETYYLLGIEGTLEDFQGVMVYLDQYYIDWLLQPLELLGPF